jgi:hypothetical protein
MYETAQDTALLLAAMLHRSRKTRGRISEKTIKFISQRERLKGAFVTDLRGQLEELGVMMVPLDRGGFALVALSALEGAPSLLARDYIANEVKSLRRAKLDQKVLWAELGLGQESESE